MSLAKATFFLPLHDNNGRDLAKEINIVRAEMYNRFSGWTREGIVEGAYRMQDGGQALDSSAKHFVVVEESRLKEVEEILLQFKADASQEKVYLEIDHNLDVRFL